MRVAIYTRVSTTKRLKDGEPDEKPTYEQNPEVQEQQLRQLSAQRGWEVVKVYTDRASGGKEKRPGLSQLMADARRGLFSVVIVWRFDRFARSVKQLVNAMEKFRVF